MSGRILVGPKRPIVKHNKGFGEQFFEKAQIFKDTIFQIHGKTGESQTYAQVFQRSIRVAIGLQKLGVKEKDIVMLCCYNDLNNIVPWIACFFLGAVSCSVDTELDVNDIHDVTRLVKPKVVIVVDEILETVQKSLSMANSEPLIVVIGQSSVYPQMGAMECTETDDEKSFKPAKIDPNETALIMLSSGTTSTPKGICLNQNRFLELALVCEKSFKRYSNGKQIRVAHKTSMFWISAVVYTYQITAVGGAKVIAPKLNALDFLDSLCKYKVTSVIIADGSTYAIIDTLLKSPISFDFSSLKIVFVGGAKVDKSAIVVFRKLLPNTKVFNAYGSTEIGMVTNSFCTFDDPILLGKPDTVGKVADNVEIKIVDVETQAVLGPNQEGEILVKSPFLMTGYYNYENPELYDKDGFCRTGDLGYYDEDEYFFVTDRINQTFKMILDHHYYKISPSVVEAQLLLHPDVKSGVVFGIPDDECIKLPAALVVLKDDAKSSVSDILEYVNNSGIPNSHRLRGGLKFAGTIPKTASEKIARKKCVEFFLSLP